MPGEAETARAGMQLISRAAAVLRALEGQSTGRSLGQIAAATGLPRPTVQRIVDALRVERFVAEDPVRGGVRLGPAIARMAASVRTDLTAHVRPLLDALAREAQETAALTVLRDGKAVLLAQGSPLDREIMLRSQIGTGLPLHSTANGKALLLRLPADERPGLLGGAGAALPRRTARTHTSAAAVLAELEAVERGDGVAIDIEETHEGICAAGIGVIDAMGTPYSVAVIVPASRFQANLGRLRAALLDCRAALEESAGLAPTPRPRGCASAEPGG